jgi:hypothetical protein
MKTVEKQVQVEIGGINFDVKLDYTAGTLSSRTDPLDGPEIDIKEVILTGAPLDMQVNFLDLFDEVDKNEVLEEKVWEAIEDEEEEEDEDPPEDGD